MAKRSDLEPWEVSLIKALLDLGTLNKQEILAFFTRPGRDINHRAIPEVQNAGEFAGIAPATMSETDVFLNVSRAVSDLEFASLRTLMARIQGQGRFSFEYRFFPVGQGLFSSGSIQRENGEPFRWVYDCGTSEDPRIVNRQIAALRARWSPSRRKSKLDMLVISHFDKDHISGLRTLMTHFSVGMIVLPYIPPWDRLVIALCEDAEAGTDLFAFIMNPAGFISTLPGGEDVQIILVAAGDGPARPPAEPDETSPKTWDGPLKIRIDGARDRDDQSSEGDRDLENPRVTILEAGGSLTIPGLWEFVPYNDPGKLNLATPSFRAAAAPLAESLRSANNPAAAEFALERLKAVYEATFGSESKDKNQISLLLYSGPIGGVSLHSSEQTNFRGRFTEWPTGALGRAGSNDRFGLMLTGDAYLKTKSSLQAMISFFSSHSRLSRGACFQVMHHGSRWNWQVGLARKINPIASIFSSNPNAHYYHPHSEVLNDFSPFGPRQVDYRTGWGVRGVFSYL